MPLNKQNLELKKIDNDNRDDDEESTYRGDDDDDDRSDCDDDDDDEDDSDEENMPPNDFSFDGDQYQKKMAHDHCNYRQKLQNSIPTVICCVCNQLTAEIKCNPNIFKLEHQIFNKLFESTGRVNRYSKTSAKGIEDSFDSRYVIEIFLDEHRICSRWHYCLKIQYQELLWRTDSI